NAETADLFARTQHPYTRDLLASIPLLEQDRDKPLYSIKGLPPDLAHVPQGCRYASRCALASDKCRLEEPSLRGDDPAHTFACWHPVDGRPAEVSVTLSSRPPQAP